MNLSYSPQEMAAVAIVLALVELVKPKFNSKYYRYLPLPFAFFMASCIIVETHSGFPGWWVFFAQIFQTGLKISFAAMGLFDLVLKPKKSDRQDNESGDKKEE